MRSFTDDVCCELAQTMPAATCCRRAMLYGLLINAECGVGSIIHVRMNGAAAIDITPRLIEEQYGRSPELVKINCYGRISAEADFESVKLASLLTGLTSDTGETVLSLIIKCKSCASAFCAGLILSSARLGNPEKGSRIEFAITDYGRAAFVTDCFDRHGVNPSVSERNGIPSLIFKRSDDVELILALAGAKQAAMTLMQQKMIRELRGNVNRASNCEVRNIGAAANAAKKQLEAVALLRTHGKFAVLNDELKESAILREREPELSMSELAALHNPPITKSGLNHRMEKIIGLAQTIKEQDV